MIELLTGGDAAGGLAATNDPQRLSARGSNARHSWGPNRESLFDSLFSASLASPPPPPARAPASNDERSDDPSESVGESSVSSEPPAAEDRRDEPEESEGSSAATESAGQAAQAAAAAAMARPADETQHEPEASGEGQPIEATASPASTDLQPKTSGDELAAPAQALVKEVSPQAADAEVKSGDVATQPTELAELRSTRHAEGPSEIASQTDASQKPDDVLSGRVDGQPADVAAELETVAASPADADLSAADRTTGRDAIERRDQGDVDPDPQAVAAEQPTGRRQDFLRDRRRGESDAGPSRRGGAIERSADAWTSAVNENAVKASEDASDASLEAAGPQPSAGEADATSIESATPPTIDPTAAQSAAGQPAAVQSAAATSLAAAVTPALSQPVSAVAASAAAGSVAAASAGVEAIGAALPTSVGAAPTAATAPAASAAAPQQAAAAVAVLPEISLSPYQQTRMLQRVLGGLERLSDGRSTVRLRLHPPELGALQVSLTMTQNAVSASVTVEDASVAEVLQANLPALRQKLAEQGVTVERFDFQLASDTSGDASAGWMGDPQAGSRRGESEDREQRRELESVGANRRRGVAGGDARSGRADRQPTGAKPAAAGFDVRA